MSAEWGDCNRHSCYKDELSETVDSFHPWTYRPHSSTPCTHRFLVNHLVRHPDSFCTDDIHIVVNIKIELSVENGGFSTLENISDTEIKGVTHVDNEGN